MQALLTIVSYVALLLLIMPATLEGIIQTALLLLLGTALLIWKKPWTKSKQISKATYFVGLFFAAYIGWHFFNQWIYSSKVQSVAAVLHIPYHLLTAAVTAGLCVFAVIFLAGLLQHAKGMLDKREKSLAGNLFFCVTAAAATMVLSQWMIGVVIFYMGIFKIVWGIAIVAVVILSLYCLIGEVKLSAAVGSGLFMIISTVNVYIYQFRSRLFEPVDIFSAGTAMNVAENYSLFPVPFGVVIGWGIWIGLVIWMLRTGAKDKFRLSLKARAALALGCVIGVVSVGCYTANLKTYHWDKEGAMHNGYILDFVAKFKEVVVTQPHGYSTERIEEMSDRYTADTSDTGKELPHIIVIMDESFSDLRVVGDLSTNMDVIPYISSLKQNAVSGYALASIHGGNTANSEYEFLTGNSLAWMSPNVVPYQQYVQAPTYSMVSYLKTNYNYRCIAMHPYYADGWNRPVAYNHLGFDDQLFLEDFPQEQFTGYYVSDQEMFEKIVDVYENRQDEPLFLFGVTMQNHGSYTYTGDNYEQEISLVGYEGHYPDVEQYLSLIHETDKAVEYLISYFENAEDEVVIVFFGDHQPCINEEFYAELSESGFGSLNEQQKRYQVPFFIWANYEIDEKRVPCTSLNYLSGYVYEAAGIALPPYTRFLSEMEQAIPAINANGYYSLQAQSYLPLDMATGEEQSWLELYEQLQYNSGFDKNNRNEKLFPVLE